MKVKEIMKKVIAVDFDMSLREAAKIMSGKDIGSLVVMKADSIKGIITEKDFVKNASNMNQRISSVMAKQIVTIDQEENLEDAAEIMKRNKVKHLPVLKEDKLVGIITSTDLIENSDDLEEDFIFD